MSYHMDKAGRKIDVRFLHNIPDAPSVNIVLGGNKIVLNLKYQELTGYLLIPSGRYDLRVELASDGTPLVQKKLKISDTSTFVVTGDVSNLSTIDLLFYSDNNGCVNSGYSSVRFVHAVYAAPSVDVYVNDKLFFASVNFGETRTTNVKLRDLSIPFQSISVKVANTSQVVLGPMKLQLDSGVVYTLFASGNAKKGLDVVVSNSQYGSCEVLQKNFNTQDYMGKWYQIASFLQPFGGDCVRSTAEYTLLSDQVNVFNTCYDENWKVRRTITGDAKIVDRKYPASLRVSFAGKPGSYESPPGPNYLIHTTDYVDYAIIGSPNRINGLYVLSRKPQMSNMTYKSLVKFAQNIGYDTSKLVVDKDALY